MLRNLILIKNLRQKGILGVRSGIKAEFRLFKQSPSNYIKRERELYAKRKKADRNVLV